MNTPRTKVRGLFFLCGWKNLRACPLQK